MPTIENILNSGGRVKILNFISIEDEVNITAITKATKLNHKRVIEHLEELKKLNIVIEKKFGRIKIFMINSNFEAGQRIKEFFKNWFLDSGDYNDRYITRFLRKSS